VGPLFGGPSSPSESTLEVFPGGGLGGGVVLDPIFSNSTGGGVSSLLALPLNYGGNHNGVNISIEISAFVPRRSIINRGRKDFPSVKGLLYSLRPKSGRKYHSLLSEKKKRNHRTRLRFLLPAGRRLNPYGAENHQVG